MALSFTWYFALFLLKSTVLASSKPVVFAVIGDWGWGPDGDYSRLLGGQNMNHTAGQRAVAKVMGQMCQKHNCKFVINTGDNFYDLGIDATKSCYDPQWETSFNQVYSAASLKKLKFYSVLGNHEYGKNGTGATGVPHSIYPQIEYTICDPLQRWYLPWRYYDVDVPGVSQRIRITTVDSSPFISSYCNNPSSKYSTPEMLQNCQDKVRQGDLAHFKLRTADAKKKKIWNIALGHHPIFGSYGPNQPFHDMIVPIVKVTKPDIYFAGHDHIIAHVNYTTVLPDTNLFVIGSSGITDAGSSLPQPGFQDKYAFANNVYGFAIVTLYKDHGNIKFYGVDPTSVPLQGVLQYTYKFTK